MTVSLLNLIRTAGRQGRLDPNIELLLPTAAIPHVIRSAFVGSRVTCSPPPIDTDNDILIQSHYKRFGAALDAAGWTRDIRNSLSTNPHHNHSARYASPPGINFISYRQGDTNLIVTPDAKFYNKFMAATRTAKALNLMSKKDRVTLFQAILYEAYP